MQWTTERFPTFECQVRELADQHKELVDEPMHLAIAYDPGRDMRDIFLFELLGNFGRGEVSPDGELFEVTFRPSDDFPLERDQRIHLVLSSPQEFRVALAQHWTSAEELRAAVGCGDYIVVFEDETGHEFLSLLRE